MSTALVSAAEQAVAWSPIPVASNLQAFLEVVRQEGALPACGLTLMLASRTLGDASPLTRAAWRLQFQGVVQQRVDPASMVPALPRPSDDGVIATWKVANSRLVATFAAKRLPGWDGVGLEHFVICTLYHQLYQIVARACESTPLTGTEAAGTLAAYDQRVDALLARARG